MNNRVAAKSAHQNQQEVILVNDSDLFIRQSVNGADIVITTKKAGNQSLRFPGNPLENRQHLVERLGLNLNSLVYMGAEMKDHVVFVTSSDGGRGSLSQKDSVACDAMFTNEHGVFLVLEPGDCATIFVIHELFWGIIHAGRANASAVIPKAIKWLCKTFGVDPKSVLVALGPIIGNAPDEEKSPVDDSLRYFFTRNKEEYIRDQLIDPDWIKSGAIVEYADGWEILLAKYVEFALRKVGVIRVLNPHLDTLSGQFFSHSLSVKTGSTEGRHACLIGRF
jgi:copper oxidase (laccase) domain-containing protein